MSLFLVYKLLFSRVILDFDLPVCSEWLHDNNLWLNKFLLQTTRFLHWSPSYQFVSVQYHHKCLSARTQSWQQNSFLLLDFSSDLVYKSFIFSISRMPILTCPSVPSDLLKKTFGWIMLFFSWNQSCFLHCSKN